MKYVSILALFLLNAVDAISTHLAIQHGFAQEGNPLMAALYHISPWCFLGFKAAIGVVLVVLSPFLWERARWGIYILLGVYGLVVLWHCLGWYMYLTGLLVVRYPS